MEDEPTEKSFTDILKSYALPAIIIAGILLVIIGLAYIIAAYGGGHKLETPFLGGIFNYPVLFGIQLYFWLFIALIILAVGNEIFWRFTMWDPLAPFHGLYKAFTDGTKAALVGDLNLDWALLSESRATIIFDPDYYNFAISDFGWWVKFRVWLYKPDFSASVAATLEGRRDEATLLTIGRIATHLIIDTDWWADKNSPQRKSIAAAADKYNRANPTLPQVHRFITFIKYVNDGKIIKPDNVIIERTIPWARIDAAFPIVRSDAAWGGFVRQIAEELKDPDTANMNKWAAYVLIFSAALCLLMFASSWFFPAHPAAVAAAVQPVATIAASGMLPK